MSAEHSAGAVIFRKDYNPPAASSPPSRREGGAPGGEIYYLLLNYTALGKIEKTYWGFPKGHIEKGEKEIDTVKREVAEETGIKDIKFIDGFKETEKYFFKQRGKTVFKTVSYLLAETKTKEINLSFEHLNYKWLPYEKAIGQLTFKNAKEILKKANDFLAKHEA